MATAEVDGVGEGPQVFSTSAVIETLCGPLLNYRHMTNPESDSATWHGSVLIVTTPGQRDPVLKLRRLGASVPSEEGPALPDVAERTFQAEKLYEDTFTGFWRFLVDLPLGARSAKWEYHVPNLAYKSGSDSDRMSIRAFHVPAAHESMRMMFHSCNGFSVGTDEEAWSGCALWNDVLRKHTARPIHVMIGGGDQIYNDGIRVDGPLRQWCDIRNPVKRRNHDFNEKLRAECDRYYLDNYVKWYSTEPFASANGCIPQINIWDDHGVSTVRELDDYCED